MIKQLRNLQVYTADEVIQEWRVRYKGKWVKGPPGNGNVALVAENDILKIYLAAKGGFETDQTPVELVDEVFNFCGILTHNPEHSEMCLHVALSQSNPTRISKVFADKGIPSLESLKFADADKSNSDEDEEYPRAAKSPETKGSSSSGPKERSRPFRDLSVAEVIFGLPVGIATGLGGLVNRNKHFDGKDDEDDTWGKTDVETTKEKPMAKKPKSLTSDKQRRCGADALQKFHKSVSKGWLIVQQVAFSSACVEDVAFKGELVVSGPTILFHNQMHFSLTYPTYRYTKCSRRHSAKITTLGSIGLANVVLELTFQHSTPMTKTSIRPSSFPTSPGHSHSF